MDTAPVREGDILAGKYRVERVLGIGGMGVVVAALHLELRERRAIKLMLPTALSNVEAVERFLREARAASRLRSEHVAKVYDVGRLDNGSPYMVMEYLDGVDLGVELKRRGPLAVPDTALYVLQTCEALAEAHAAGIIHRDLKPANLFLTTRPDGTPCVKVLDFGISKMASETGSDYAVTSTHTVLGSPYYMSPEQMRSLRDVDTRTDVWALGVILYQLVTGRLPFHGQTITEIITLVLSTTPELPSRLVPSVPPAFDGLVLRCLEKDLTRRATSVAELAEALAPFAPPGGGLSAERTKRLLGIPADMRLSLSGALHDTHAPANSQPVTGGWGTTSAHAGAGRSRAPFVIGGAAAALALAGAAALGISHFAAQRAPSTADQAHPAPPHASIVAAPSAAEPSAATAAAATSASAPLPAAPASASAPLPVASAPPRKPPVARPARAPSDDPFGTGRK